MRRELLSCCALAALTITIFAAAARFPFISYDDPGYVTEAPFVQRGLTLDGVQWAFTTGALANYHPLTWLSHMLDVELFGLSPAGHHLTSVLLHAANVVLVFLLFSRTTSSPWRSAFVAALFALHPLRVESVAWVSERKDVLCGFFFLLTLLGYVRYAQRPGAGRYALMLLAYAAALLAKPMVVTLPFVLLLLNYWPLARWSIRRDDTASPVGGRGSRRAVRDAAHAARREPRPPGLGRWRSLVLEKLPLLGMAIAASIATVVAQHGAGAVKSMERYPFELRLANASISYVRYVGKTVWPSGLSVFYPLPDAWPAWMVAASVAALIGVTLLAWRLRRAAPYFPVGWLWFTGMLVPVIGLVQVGDQSLADRYTYLPGIGLVLVIVWGAADALRLFGRYRVAIGASAGAIAIVILSILTIRQLQHWRGGTISLFRHAIEVTENNALAHRHLGSALADAKDYSGATAHLQAALRLRPASAQTHFNYGNLLLRQSRFRAAADAYRTAVKLDGRFAVAHNSLGAALAADGRHADAEAAFRAAIDADTAYAEPHANLGKLLALQGRHAEAIERYRAALRLRPQFPLAKEGLAKSLDAVKGAGGGQ